MKKTLSCALLILLMFYTSIVLAQPPGGSPPPPPGDTGDGGNVTDVPIENDVLLILFALGLAVYFFYSKGFFFNKKVS